ncbi:hypothetical protein R3W88_032165 [Solanum pinnatisectum]|uniref:Uncharacterized protein n=1 Tax=Solanum pinnatisectum TaxID=50273 RepID=A0AAV9LP09_9SOLN|nr:hypothetical protein R3W88_032165 [Solanum pinnatisectum]
MFWYVSRYIPECTFQAQMHRCLMTLEVEQENPDELWISVNGSILWFTISEFALNTRLNKRLLVDYFHGSTNIKKEHLIKYFNDKMWGSKFIW